MSGPAESRWDLPARHDVPFEPSLALDVVEVWRDDRDLLWRWRYRGHDGTDLMAHRTFATRASAVEAAGIAYPGILIRDRPEPPARPSHRVRWAIVALAAMVAITTAGIGLLLVAAVVAAATAVRAAQRRWGTR